MLDFLLGGVVRFSALPMNELTRSTRSQSPVEAVEVSVVIPALNVADTIGQQLDGLACQNFNGNWEVIVADNGSTDSTREVVESFADRLPALKVIDASDRRGINHARNVGSQAARGRYPEGHLCRRGRCR